MQEKSPDIFGLLTLALNTWEPSWAFTECDSAQGLQLYFHLGRTSLFQGRWIHRRNPVGIPKVTSFKSEDSLSKVDFWRTSLREFKKSQVLTFLDFFWEKSSPSTGKPFQSKGRWIHCRNPVVITISNLDQSDLVPRDIDPRTGLVYEHRDEQATNKITNRLPNIARLLRGWNSCVCVFVCDDMHFGYGPYIVRCECVCYMTCTADMGSISYARHMWWHALWIRALYRKVCVWVCVCVYDMHCGYGLHIIH